MMQLSWGGNINNDVEKRPCLLLPHAAARVLTTSLSDALPRETGPDEESPTTLARAAAASGFW